MKSKTLISLLIVAGFSFVANTLKAQWTLTAPHIYNNNTGNVGIKSGGTSFVPTALFQVQNGSVLFDGTTGSIPLTGEGSRMMWLPSKNAFRVGYVTGLNWDEANIGIRSFASGYNTKASGANSTAMGNGAIASGNYSTALGSGIASGNFSISAGNGTASGINSFAAQGSTASGVLSTSFGSFTTAQSNNSFVIGRYNYNPGTYSPSTWILTDPLFVIGNGTSANATSNAMTVLKNGNVGIGTASPFAPLHIIGSNAFPQLKIASSGTGSAIYGSFLSMDATATPGGKDWLIFSTAGSAGEGTGKLIFKNQTDGIYGLTITNTGIVGIGTPLTDPTSASYKLAVNGDIRAKRIVVETGWSDFVFEKNYKLRSLDEVETYIRQNGHLPEIPGANEIECNGGDLGELVKLQMQKIEELTLYVIEQNKRIEALEKK